MGRYQSNLDVGRELGHYHLINLLDRRGLIEVWQAQHVILHTQVALKILPLHASHEPDLFRYETRLRCEAQVLAELHHQHIVGFRDYILWRPFVALVMQFAPYRSLARAHPPGRKVPLPQVRRYVEQIGAALFSLHRRGLLHRDVKPGNILLLTPRHALLADFGLAIDDPMYTLHPRLELAREGTLAYMAPEQYHGYPCTASDQYSLALSAYEWLSGHRPFSGESSGVMDRRVRFVPPSVRLFRPELPLAVDEILWTALDPDPERRYPSVWDFARAFADVTRTARPPLARRLPYDRATRLPDTAEIEALHLHHASLPSKTAAIRVPL